MNINLFNKLVNRDLPLYDTTFSSSCEVGTEDTMRGNFCISLMKYSFLHKGLKRIWYNSCRIVRKRSSLTNIISTQKFTKPFKRHCVKGVRLRSYSGPHFPAFGLNMERYSISPYSVRMRENADQNHSEYGHSSRSAYGHVRAHDRLKTIHLLNQNTYGHLSGLSPIHKFEWFLNVVIL